MKRVLTVILLLCAAATGAWLAWSRWGPKADCPLTVWLTGDIRGRLVPCGCFTGQLGGLTRIATMMDSKPGEQTLKVDIGDALEGTRDYERIQLTYIHRAFSQLGYDAVNLGHREAALPAEQLRQLAQESPVPLLSANLLDAASGQPVAKPFVIVTKGRWRIAVVGVMDSRIPPDQLGTGLRIDTPENSLARILPSLKTQADFRVLLAFTNEAALHSLAREFPEFNLVLGGKVTQPAQSLEHEGRTAILYVTNESRALGSIEAVLRQDGSLAVSNSEVRLVEDKVPENPAIVALAKACRDQIRKTRLDVDDPSKATGDLIPGVRAPATFAGSDSCAKCHPGADRIWRETRHVHAFASLVTAGADADPNCLACHTVGFGSPGGYRREFSNSKLVDVGCESCHGPGGRHVEARMRGDAEAGRLRPLGAGDCKQCHHGEFSRPFDWNEFWPLVKHGRESAAP
jgi:hypothetical protein